MNKPSRPNVNVLMSEKSGSHEATLFNKLTIVINEPTRISGRTVITASWIDEIQGFFVILFTFGVNDSFINVIILFIFIHPILVCWQ